MEGLNIPENTEYLIEIFWDLWDSEGWSWSELYHYQEIMDIELDGSELYLLRSTMGACSTWLADKTKPKKKATPSQSGKGRGRK